MFSELVKASGNFIFWKGDVKRRQHIHSSLSPRQLHITATQNDSYLIFQLKNAFSYLQIESSLVVVEVVEAVSLTYPGFCTTGCALEYLMLPFRFTADLRENFAL